LLFYAFLVPYDQQKQNDQPGIFIIQAPGREIPFHQFLHYEFVLNEFIDFFTHGCRNALALSGPNSAMQVVVMM